MGVPCLWVDPQHACIDRWLEFYPHFWMSIVISGKLLPLLHVVPQLTVQGWCYLDWLHPLLPSLSISSPLQDDSSPVPWVFAADLDPLACLSILGAPGMKRFITVIELIVDTVTVIDTGHLDRAACCNCIDFPLLSFFLWEAVYIFLELFVFHLATWL